MFATLVKVPAKRQWFIVDVVGLNRVGQLHANSGEALDSYFHAIDDVTVVGFDAVTLLASALARLKPIAMKSGNGHGLPVKFPRQT